MTMTLSPIRCLILCLACLLGTTAQADTPTADQSLAAEFPAGSIASPETAQAALARVPVVRAEVQQRFAREQADCYERFLVSSCLSDSRQRQRRANSTVRKVEVEARAFLRREKAEERDRALAERERKAEGDASRAIPFSGAVRDAGASEKSEAGDQ